MNMIKLHGLPICKISATSSYSINFGCKEWKVAQNISKPSQLLIER